MNGQVYNGHWNAEAPPMVGDLVDGEDIDWNEVLKNPRDDGERLRDDQLKSDLGERTYRVKSRLWAYSDVVHVFLENPSDAEKDILLSYWQINGLT